MITIYLVILCWPHVIVEINKDYIPVIPETPPILLPSQKLLFMEEPDKYQNLDAARE